MDPIRKPIQVFQDDCTYLVTGGAGGFGSSLIRYAHYERGCNHFLITTRSTDHDKVTRRSMGVDQINGQQAISSPLRIDSAHPPFNI